APPSDHSRIEGLLDRMEDAIRARERGHHAELSTEFHKLLTQRCHNERLLRVLRDCERHIQWLETIYYRDIDASENSMREHREIARRYIEKDLLGLISAIQDHTRRQRNLVIAAMIGQQRDIEESPQRNRASQREAVIGRARRPHIKGPYIPKYVRWTSAFSRTPRAAPSSTNFPVDIT